MFWDEALTIQTDIGLPEIDSIFRAELLTWANAKIIPLLSEAFFAKDYIQGLLKPDVSSAFWFSNGS